MTPNIKDREAHELARRVAALNGTSLTGAVIAALREKLAKDEAEKRSAMHMKKRSEVLKEFSALTAPLFKGGRTGNDLINDLYDESTGLPK